jgi:hypothetical protein
MPDATNPKPKPSPAILVYGAPTNPELTQASWFRTEDKVAAKAAAETLKFSVLELRADVEKGLTAGVHEGVLKGSGRMIVGSVSSEVYRRIIDHVGETSGADASPKASLPQQAAAEPAKEQNMNVASTVMAPTESPTSHPIEKSTRVAFKPARSSNAGCDAAPESQLPSDPWQEPRVSSLVLGAYWDENGDPCAGLFNALY